MYKSIRKESGFSLLETIVAVSILSITITIVFFGVSNFVDRSEVQENEKYIQSLANAFKSHYESYAFEVESNSGASYNLPSQGISINNGAISTSSLESLEAMSRSVSIPNLRFTDGFNQPFKILISNRLEKEYQGVYIPYRVIAIVSNVDGDFVNGVPDFDTTMNVNTGEVNINDGELVSTFNTYKTQVNKFIETKKKIDKIANAYTQFYWSRYNQSSGGGIRSRNYFASGGSNWDSGTSIARTCGSSRQIEGHNSPGTNISSTGLSNELNIGVSSYLDEWGQELYMLNCGSVDNIAIGNSTVRLRPRSPDSPDSNKRTHPYNAIIGVTLSNGQSYIKTLTARM